MDKKTKTKADIPEDVKTFFETKGIDITKKPYYHFITKNGITRLTQSTGTIAELFETHTGKEQNKRFLTNCYAYINTGTTTQKQIQIKGKYKDEARKDFSYSYPVTKDVEERKDTYRTSYNAFYFDFDLHDATGNHYQGAELEDQKENLLSDILCNIPQEIRPTIVETRNGYQIYFDLAPQDRNINGVIWKRMEFLLYQFMRESVNPCVDAAAIDGARILRIPCTYHRKADSDEYYITVKYQSRQYTLDELWQNIPFVELDKRYPVSRPKQRKQKANAKNATTTNNAINAIKNLDVDYFEHIQKLNTRLSVYDAARYIKSQNMIDLLELDVQESQAFSSIIRKDSKPSCNISLCKDEKYDYPVYLYFDRGRNNATYNAIGIVQQIAKCTNYEAYNFLCKVYGIESYSNAMSIRERIDLYMSIFDAMANEYKYIGKARETYKAILSIWEREQEKNNTIPPHKHRLMIGGEYIAQMTGQSRINVTKHILALIHADFLTKEENPLEQNNGKKKVNVVTVNNITQNKSKIKKQLQILQDGLVNVWQNITAGNLIVLTKFN